MRTISAFPNLYILDDHPLINHKLNHMRKKDTSTGQFRHLLRDIALLTGYEATRDLHTITEQIETPLMSMDAAVVDEWEIAIVSILRAGLSMAEGLHGLLPGAREGHIGVFRDHETKKPVEYYINLPSARTTRFIVADPMVATGNSAIHAVDVINRHGVSDDRICFVGLVAAPEGVRAFHEAHPNVPLYTAALDDHLDENAYIVPGLGDAGDRIFGTE
jgi:uracil phosphoribosyltransferase